MMRSFLFHQEKKKKLERRQRYLIGNREGGRGKGSLKTLKEIAKILPVTGGRGGRIRDKVEC